MQYLIICKEIVTREYIVEADTEDTAKLYVKNGIWDKWESEFVYSQDIQSIELFKDYDSLKGEP